jgi:cobalt-precorrin 5A hydrolase
LKGFTGALFQQYDSLVFVMAMGIAVRCIAPWLHHKSTDPGVVVIDEMGTFAISLLSGHLAVPMN